MIDPAQKLMALGVPAALARELVEQFDQSGNRAPLLAVKNLSDLKDVLEARNNLGLGTAATKAAEEFATSAQGSMAETAVQPEQLDGALEDYAPLESPAFTGTVTGITKSMVGLGSVDNTSDIDKPVSTAQAEAIQEVRDDLAADTGATLVGFKQSGDGAVDRTLADKAREWVSVKDFGAVGDGITEDTEAIQKADDVVSATGGKVIYPPGTYLVSFGRLSLTQRACIVVGNGVQHVGSGVGSTTIKIADGANAHGFLLRNTTNSAVMSMTIDGNSANQGTPESGNDSSGILLVGNAARYILRDLRIHNCYDYGIGVQVGTSVDGTIQNVLIENVGSDGIDFKNTNKNSNGNRITGLTVRNFGLRETGEIFAGLDIRGEMQADSIRVSSFSGDKTGIRIMPDDTSGLNAGGKRSQLSNFLISATVEGRTTSKGVHSRDMSCVISNGYISGAAYGLVGAQRECAYSNIVIESCVTGILLDNDETDGGSPLPTDPDNNSFSNITIRGCSAIGIDVESDNNSFSNAVCRGNAQNVRVASGATFNRFLGGNITAPTGTINVEDNGTESSFIGVFGITNDANIWSEEIALDTTGTISVSVNHGLAFTPTPSDVSATLYIDNAADDFEIGGLWVRTVNATIISAKLKVSTESATAGLKGRILFRVATRV